MARSSGKNTQHAEREGLRGGDFVKTVEYSQRSLQQVCPPPPKI